MKSPADSLRQRLRKQALLKLGKLDPKVRKRLVALEKMRRGPKDPAKA